MAWLSNGNDGERRSWHGMNQPRPKLPYYFRTTKRLKGLDEFEPPAWKGRVKFGDETASLSAPTWMNIILLAVFVGGVIGWWLAQPK